MLMRNTFFIDSKVHVRRICVDQSTGDCCQVSWSDFTYNLLVNERLWRWVSKVECCFLLRLCTTMTFILIIRHAMVTEDNKQRVFFKNTCNSFHCVVYHFNRSRKDLWVAKMLMPIMVDNNLMNECVCVGLLKLPHELERTLLVYCKLVSSINL